VVGYRGGVAGPPQRRRPRLDRLPPPGLPAAGGPDVTGDVATWGHVRMTGPVLDTPPAVRRLRFDQCELRGVTLPAGCHELQLVDCVVGTLDLANRELAAFEATGTSFSGCRFLGATIAGTIDRSILTDCQLAMSTLRMCRVTDVEFHACSMREVDLYASVFRSVLFRSCDLEAATLAQATFANCEMDDCRLDGLRGVEALCGVRIGFSDLVAIVPELAQALGIDVTFGSADRG
jgi:hypothetical protein